MFFVSKYPSASFVLMAFTSLVTKKSPQQKFPLRGEYDLLFLLQYEVCL